MHNANAFTADQTPTGLEPDTPAQDPFEATSVAFVAVLSCNEPFLSIFPQNCVFAADKRGAAGGCYVKGTLVFIGNF